MYRSAIPDENPILAAWREQLEHARTKPFLFQLLLKQFQRVLKRLAYFYAHLASLPRRNRRALQRTLATSLIGAAMLLALSSAPVVLANSITVSGACTLDEAITNANNDAATFPDCAAGSGPDTISLTGNVTIGVDTPAAALPAINSTILLEGGGNFVSGANSFRVFYVTSTGDFTLNDTTVKDGNVVGNGGGIYSKGTLKVTNSTISNNVASGYGGGIANSSGTAEILDSVVSGNDGAEGGGIHNYYGNLIVANSTISYNDALGEDGGGLRNAYGTTTVQNSVVYGNTAVDDGGGLNNRGYGGKMFVINTTLSGNSAGTGAGNIGGGFRGAIGAISYLTNVTITNNSSGDDGGGLAFEPGSLVLQNSIISGNKARSSYTDSYADCYDYGMTDNGYNLVGDGTGCPTSGTGDITVLPADVFTTVLGDLLDNGGPTKTHALLPNSPALDKVPNASCSGKPVNGVDQRGFPRNVDIVPPPTANDCDIGAFELQLSTAVNVTNVRAVARDEKNILKWQTTSEAQIAGFNVYRKTARGEWKQVNAKFKQAKNPGGAQGNQYAFRDKKVNAGKTYRYKLEVKYLDGHSEWTEIVRVKTR